MMDECRFHGIERDLLKVAETQVVFLASNCHFLRQVRVAHQPVVRTQEDAEVIPEKDGEGVCLK